jgi:CheY-like chemotaxis protein
LLAAGAFSHERRAIWLTLLALGVTNTLILRPATGDSAKYKEPSLPTILVADDNSNIQKMVANALKERGIEVIGVANGDAAIKKLEILNPDMVLADVFMPVKDGYELCEWIKSKERLAAVPVFLLVGAFDPLDEHRVQTVKADGVLKKPFVPPDHLIGAVSAMLERAAKSRAAAEMQTAHDAFASSVPHVDDTQRLSDAEIAEQVAQAGGPAAAAPPPPPPELEPEMDLYATRPARLTFDESEQPMGFDSLEGSGAETEEEEAAFRPSAMEGMEGGYAEHAGITEEMRQPSPDEPPIKVDFTGEKIELVTSDNAEGMASFTRMSGAAPDLVASGADVMAAPPPPAAEPLPPPPPPMEMSVPEVRPPEPEPEPEPEPAAAPMGVPSAELPGLSWSQSAAAAPAAEPEPPAPAMPASPPPAAPAPVPTAADVTMKPMPLSAVQQQVLVDEIVDRVVSQLQPQIVHRITSEIGKGLEMLQPQLLERITKEVIRPMAEDMFKKKTE